MARVHPDHHPPVALLTLRLTWEVAEGSGREAVAQERTPQQLSMTVNDRVTGAKYVLETSWTLIYCQGGQRRTVEEASILLDAYSVKSESEVAQSCPTLSDPMDCSLPGSSVHEFSRQEYWSGVPLPSPVYY